MLRHSKNRRNRERGTVLVEFVMILPLFLFLTLFAIDMGRMILVSGAVNDAAYVAARAGAQAGRAGNAENGPSRKAFDRAISGIPGTNNTDTAGFKIIEGACTDANSYILIEAEQRVNFITPGLGALLAAGTDNSSDEVDTRSGWRVNSRASVLCEIVR